MRVLVPIDYSATSTNAFRYALKLTEAISADCTIELIHVFPIHISSIKDQNYEANHKIMEKEEKEQLAKLEAFAADFDEKVGTQCCVNAGIQAGDCIVSKAAEGNYDLIIMGTKGQHGLLDKWFGSVTTHVIHQASCPVLVIPEDALWVKPRRIGYGSELNPEERPTLEQLIEFCRMLDAKLNYVHVLTEGEGETEKDFPIDMSDIYPIEFSLFYAMSTTSVVEGFDEFVRQSKLDMIALFTPQRKLWDRLFHKSFSNRMVFHSKIPLLVYNDVK